MIQIEWLNNNSIKTDKLKKPKKITGTRLAAILGKNPWNTPFAVWADMTHVYEEPFIGIKYTNAGNVIEPKQAEYVKQLGFSNIKSPIDIYGENYFEQTYGDFFPNDQIFGGMWDYINVIDGVTQAVFEMKTTKNVSAWNNGPPEYYKLQSALYAYLLRVDTIYIVVSFLQEKDYDAPELFIPTIENTRIYKFSLHDDFFNFEGNCIIPAINWYQKYIATNISPQYTSKDSKIINSLKSINIRNHLLNKYPNAVLLDDKFDSAIIGYSQTGNIIYSGKKLQNLHCDITIGDNPIVLYEIEME